MAFVDIWADSDDDTPAPAFGLGAQEAVVGDSQEAASVAMSSSCDGIDAGDSQETLDSSIESLATDVSAQILEEVEVADSEVDDAAPSTGPAVSATAAWNISACAHHFIGVMKDDGSAPEIVWPLEQDTGPDGCTWLNVQGHMYWLRKVVTGSSHYRKSFAHAITSARHSLIKTAKASMQTKGAKQKSALKALRLHDSDDDPDGKQSTKNQGKQRIRRAPHDTTTVLRFQWEDVDIEGRIDRAQIKIKVTIKSINALVGYVRLMVKKLEACVFYVNGM